MQGLTIVFTVIGAIVSWIIFYYVVKAAVRDGMREARKDPNVRTFVTERKPEKPERPANPAQARLQGQYERGQITLETYQAEWNKLQS